MKVMWALIQKNGLDQTFLDSLPRGAADNVGAALFEERPAEKTMSTSRPKETIDLLPKP
jgi:hypothetical protein